MHQNILSIENLTVAFGREGQLRAVETVSFVMNREEILGLVGESGCGKTLTALSVLKLLPPGASSSGRIIFHGEDIYDKSYKELRHIRGNDISMIFQEPMTSLNPVFTIGDQVAEIMTTHLNIGKKQAADATADLLRTVGIPSPEVRRREYPHQMSGGMRQRVMIAMAISCNPLLLIADEPTTALDVTIQAQIIELLNDLKIKNRMSLLLITHDLGIINEWADRIIVMYAGRIVEEADVREAFLNPRHPYTLGLLGSLPSRKDIRLDPIPGQVPKLGELPHGCTFSPRCRYVIDQCRTREPALLRVPAQDTSHRKGEHLSRCYRAMEL